MINLKGEKTEREIVPEGNHIARLYSIIELGTVPVAYKEEPVRQVRFTWELPEEMREFDEKQKPMVIGNAYTASMYKEAKLRKIVEGVVGKMTDAEADEFDLHSVIGKPCMLNVVHTLAKNGKTYANVASAAPLPKAVKEVPEQINPSLYFDYADFEDATYEKIPQWIRNEMAESEEMKKRVSDLANSTVAESPTDASAIPF